LRLSTATLVENVQTTSTSSPTANIQTASTATFATNPQSNNETMVLEEHHRSNGAPHPPDANLLTQIRQSVVASRRRAKRHSKTPYVRGQTTDNPRHFRFYPPKWRDVLEIGRWNFRLHLATNHPFPDRKHGLDKAKDCLTQAVLYHERQGYQVEPGKLTYNTSSTVTKFLCH
jgi:hypothetical protein